MSAPVLHSWTARGREITSAERSQKCHLKRQGLAARLGGSRWRSAVLLHTPSCVWKHTLATTMGTIGSSWTVNSLAQPSAEKKGVEQRDTEIQEMPERVAATVGAHRLTRCHIGPNTDEPNIMYVHSPVIASLFREKVVISKILK